MALRKRSYQRTFNYDYLIESGDNKIDTSGYATISNTGSLGEFDGTTVPAIATQSDYELDITVDGGSVTKLATISINIADDWDDIAAAIQTALRAATSSTETVAIVDGKIKITSATNGSSSSIVIAAGTAGTGSGDLLAVITALGATYTATVDTPVDGVEGAVEIDIVLSGASNSLPSNDFLYMVQVRDSDGKIKAGIKSSYSKTTGILTVEDDGSTTELAVGDAIIVMGHFYE